MVQTAGVDIKKDIALGTNECVDGKGLSMEIIKHVEPTFKDLQNYSLLSKYLHEKTQNQNESFNSIIWKHVPKDVFIGGKTFTMGVMDSVSHFNDGNIATLNCSRTWSLHINWLQKGNVESENNPARKSGEGYRSRRKYIYTWHEEI